MDDWGTKFNITSRMMSEGIADLQKKGAKVHLSYGKFGLQALRGGGEEQTIESTFWAKSLAQRMVRNVEDWGLDGVDVFTLGNYERNLLSSGKVSHSCSLGARSHPSPSGSSLIFHAKLGFPDILYIFGNLMS